MTPRIFISYGHDEHAFVAEALRDELRASGLEAWYDQDRLLPGADWEAYITEGLEWVAEQAGQGRVLFLMTPHSVRRPDGYCLNELARAIQRGLPVVPVMVSTCEAPLSICRLQWFDLRDALPLTERRERFDEAVVRLVAVLRTGQVLSDGVHARLVQRLPPISFEAEIQPHLRRFTGRRWLLDQFDEWLRTEGERIFWILGGPGTGKSAIASWFATHCPEVRAVHFCRQGHAEKSDPRRAIMSLAHQLSTAFASYRARLNALDLERLTAEGNASTLFDSLVVQPLADCSAPAQGPAVLIVDALDEAGTTEQNELADVLGTEADRLPPWLRLCLTSRPEPSVMHALQGVTPIVLDAAAPANRDDLIEYLVAELPSVTGAPPSRALLDAILERSEGLFLYAEWIRRELSVGRLSINRLDAFPQGLGGVYSQYFRRQFGDLAVWSNEVRPFVEVLIAAREPLSRAQLASVFGWNAYKIAERLAQVGSLFPEQEGHVGVFHKSVADWLMDARRAGAWLVDAAGGHRRLAEWGWTEFQRNVGGMGTYAVAHLASHLHAIGQIRRDDLRGLLLDPAWMRSQLALSGIVALVADMALLEVDDDVRIVLSAMRLSRHKLAVDEGQLFSQLTGRLLSRAEPAIRALLRALPLISGNAWLRPLTAGFTAPGGPLQAIMHRREGYFTAGIMTRDGTRAISGHWGGGLIHWNLGDATVIWEVRAHANSVEQVLMAPDERSIVTTSTHGQIRMWDLETGAPLPTPVGSIDVPRTEADQEQDRQMSYEPDPILDERSWFIRRQQRAIPKTFVGLGSGGLVFRQHADVLVVSELESGRRVAAVSNRTAGIRLAEFAPDGRTLALEDQDGVLWLWDLAGPYPSRPLTGPGSSINCMVFDASRKRLIFGRMDGSCHVGFLAGDAPVKVLPGSLPLTALAVAPRSGRVLCAYGGHECSVVVWDPITATRLITLTGHAGVIYGLAIDEAESRLCSFSTDHTLRVWSLADVGHERRATHTRCVWALAVSADGKRGASGSLDASLRTWDLEAGTELAELVGHQDAVQCTAFSPDGEMLCSGAWDKTVRLWDPKSGALQHTASMHKNRVYGVSLTRRSMLSASWDGTVRTLSLLSLRAGVVIREREAKCETVAATPDGTRAIAGTDAGVVIAWELPSRRELLRVGAHDRSVWTVAISPDGRFGTSTGFDKMVKVWNLDTGALVATYSGLVDDIRAVAVTGDGSFGVFGASDVALVQLREIPTGRVLARFLPEEGVANCAITPDGKTVALGEVSGRVHFLRLERPEGNL